MSPGAKDEEIASLPEELAVARNLNTVEAFSDEALDVRPGRWLAPQLREEDWRVPIPDAVITEIASALHADAAIAAAGALANTHAFLASVRERLFHGPGVVVAGRLPVAHWGDADAQRAVSLRPARCCG